MDWLEQLPEYFAVIKTRHGWRVLDGEDYVTGEHPRPEMAISEFVLNRKDVDDYRPNYTLARITFVGPPVPIEMWRDRFLASVFTKAADQAVRLRPYAS